MGSKARLFLAASLPPSAVRELSRVCASMRRAVRARYSREENYHVTLAFLGDTDLTLVPAIGGVIERAAAGVPPVPARLGSLGFFGKPGSAVLWCGLTGAEGLEALAANIRGGLDEAGISFDRKPMKAHITLARQADLSHADLKQYAPVGREATLFSATLFESRRENGKLVYLPVFTHRLESN